MSKFIHIAIECSSILPYTVMYALDSDGTIWKRLLDTKDRPFEAFAFSPKEPKPTSTKKEKVSETLGEWMDAVRANPAYSHVNFDHEFGKMKEWFKLHPGRKLTKRFVLSWLNKIEVPGTLAETKPKLVL